MKSEYYGVIMFYAFSRVMPYKLIHSPIHPVPQST